jgi:hypothetical protein
MHAMHAGGNGGSRIPGPAVIAGGGNGGGVTAGGGGSGGGGGGGGGSWVPSPGIAAYGRPGFSEDGDTDLPGDTPLAAGSVTGYRWWYLETPDLARSPAGADEWWDPDYRNRLHGQRAHWNPGANTAACQADPGCPHDPAIVPHRECGCGFWGFWELQPNPLGQGSRTPVAGVIKGWGRTRCGPLGFRCQKARILAVTLPFPVVAEHLPAAGTASVLRRLLPASDVYGDGESLAVPAEDPAAIAHAEAWTAVIGDRIGQMYPGVRVFESVNAMQAVFPPGNGSRPR